MSLSPCYQIPAMLRGRRTGLVVSPLIALMQDQVTALRELGIEAGFLNSMAIRMCPVITQSSVLELCVIREGIHPNPPAKGSLQGG